MDTTQQLVTAAQLADLQALARDHGLPHPAAPGVTWQTLRNLAAAGA